MMSNNLITVFVYLPIFMTFSFVLTKNLLTRTKNYLPPTPFLSLPIIGNLYLFMNKPLTEAFTKLSKIYGPILYLKFGSCPVNVISSPSAIEECFRKNDQIFANRPNTLAGRVLGYNNTILVLARYGPHWRNLRRVFVAEFLSPQRLQYFSNVRYDEVKSFIRRLYSKQSCVDEGKHRTMVEVDMKDVFFELVYSVVMRMITGDCSYHADMYKGKMPMEVVEEVFKLGELSNIGDFMPFLRKFGVEDYVEKSFRQGHEKIDVIFQKMIEEQSKNCDDEEEYGQTSTNKDGLIRKLLSLRKRNPMLCTDEIIKGFIFVITIAGLHTTSTTMEWALKLLLNNPATLLKAQAEIDEHVGYNRLINEQDLNRLPYLHNIIKETLRMYPSLPLLLPHEASSDCIVQGYHIPRGTMLLANVWAIHNDPNNWAEPRCFKPDRFEEIKEIRNGYKFMPFGLGRRSCPGEGLSMRIIGLTLGALIQCFELERINNEMFDTETVVRVTRPKFYPLRLKFRPRLVNVELIRKFD